MVDYTNTLRYYSENAARGTPYMTGFTLDPNANTGNSFQAPSSTTMFIKNVDLYVESGCSWDAFNLRYPNIHVAGVTEFTNTGAGFQALQMHCKNPHKLPDGQGEEYKITGNPYYKFTLNNENPFILKNSATDVLRITFTALTGGIVEVVGSGWYVLETDDEL